MIMGFGIWDLLRQNISAIIISIRTSWCTISEEQEHEHPKRRIGTEGITDVPWAAGRKDSSFMISLFLISCLSLHPKNDDWCSSWHGCWEGNRQALLSFKAEVKPLRKNRGNVNYQLFVVSTCTRSIFFNAFLQDQKFLIFQAGICTGNKKQMATGLFGRKNCKMSSKHVW